MRVTSNLFPDTLQNQLNDLQTKQLRYQTQSATGRKIDQASDNPGDYSVALNATEDLSRMLGYVKASNDAQLHLQRNHEATKNLQKLVSRSYELAQRGNNFYNASDLQAWAVELEDIIRQVVGIANTQVDGYYLFGGTENRPPVVDQLTSAAPTSSTLLTNFNLNATTTSNVRRMDINQNYNFTVGIVAGNAGGTATGFLNNGTTDVLSVLKNLHSTLNSGVATTPAQITNLKNATDVVSEQLARTSAKLAALDANSTRLKNDQQLNKERVSELTQANLAEVLTELQKTQFHYQSALQSGARILNISLLDYVR